jgi:DNA-binding CsgD family transcriptional regulator
MARGDDLIATVEAIHTAGLDAACWPNALAALARTVGGNAASIEVVDQHTLRHREMYSYGLPGAEEIAFLPEFPQLNIRFPFVARQKLNELSWDYMILDEAAMRRAPFYAEIMPRFDIRYFVAGVALKTASEFATVAVHRSPRMGHVQRSGIATMRTLMAHMRQAFDVGRRLKTAAGARDMLERALDRLADAVALLRADGAVVYANDALQAISRRGDGVRLRRGMIELAAADARARLDDAIAAVLRLRDGDIATSANCDFPVPRSTGASPYVVSVRPLMDNEHKHLAGSDAVAIVFIRDPLSRNIAAVCLLREVFGLTDAEAGLAQALQSGVPPGAYAQDRAISLNTVYTHLRRIKEKTGCNRMAELIAKLNDLQVPLRID